MKKMRGKSMIGKTPISRKLFIPALIFTLSPVMKGWAGNINGTGRVDGTGSISCDSTGIANGMANVAGVVQITGDGLDGLIPVSGTVVLSGNCSKGDWGMMSTVGGTANIIGSGTLYDSNGRAVSITISGMGFVSGGGSGSMVPVGGTVSVSN